MDRHGSCVTSAQDSQPEAAILSLLLNSEGGCVWSVHELVRELSAPRVSVVDALANLEASSLIHRCHEFVFATRAAWRFDQLDM